RDGECKARQRSAALAGAVTADQTLADCGWTNAPGRLSMSRKKPAPGLGPGVETGFPERTCDRARIEIDARDANRTPVDPRERPHAAASEKIQQNRFARGRAV
ncbi:MAG: hypothetical protein ACLQFW_18035, partial [Xanthobacteraceae bacterium]